MILRQTGLWSVGSMRNHRKSPFYAVMSGGANITSVALEPLSWVGMFGLKEYRKVLWILCELNLVRKLVITMESMVWLKSPITIVCSYNFNRSLWIAVNVYKIRCVATISEIFFERRYLWCLTRSKSGRHGTALTWQSIVYSQSPLRRVVVCFRGWVSNPVVNTWFLTYVPTWKPNPGAGE